MYKNKTKKKLKKKSNHAVRVVQIVGTEFADIECQPCSTSFGPGCTVCGVNEYQDGATGSCAACPAGTYSFEGTVGVSGCRQRPPCRTTDYFVNYTSCAAGADGSLTRGQSYAWAQPKVCDEAAPGAVSLPATATVQVPCAPCDPGTARTGVACEFCPAGL
jgi:hypothetical protein